MQIQKDEVKEKIIAVAELEFLNKGFKGASMRTIAKKSHTTLGNLYNYFENKEAILDAVVGHVPKAIEEMMAKHEKMEIIQEMPESEMLRRMEEFAPEVFGFDVLLSKPFVILMEGCRDTKYAHYREQFYEIANAHIREHLGKGKELLGKTISHSFITSLLFIGKNKMSLEEGKKALIKYMEVIILGMMASNNEVEDLPYKNLMADRD